jgi:hypothetical protein
VHVGAEQSIEEVVALARRLRLACRQHERDAEAGDARGGGGHARVVRLDRAGGHDDGCILMEGVANQEFELARLIAAERQPGEVIAFEQDARAARRAAERLAQAGGLGQRSRQCRERHARKGREIDRHGPATLPHHIGVSSGVSTLCFWVLASR